MGKGKHRKHREDNASTSGSSARKNKVGSGNTTGSISGGKGNVSNEGKPNTSIDPNRDGGSPPRRHIYQWILQERQGIIWVLGCAFLGGLLGFGIGSGFLTGEIRNPPNAWRVALGAKIRATVTYRIVTFRIMPWEPVVEAWRDFRYSDDVIAASGEKYNRLQILRSDPSHPRVFAVLREAVIREKGGYVHPDLGPLVPAPSGASRGLGMVRDSYHRCQSQCIPGVASEKMQIANTNTGDAASNNSTTTDQQQYKQEEVLVRVPLAFQMTRTVALDTLLPRISADVQRKTNFNELDDAALIVLLLAHERGVGRYSRWLPYIASLPLEPSCGYSKNLRPYMLDSVNALRDELGVDVNGWPGELLKATQYAERIVNGLARDYGNFLNHPKGMSAQENIQWALCQVASRGTAGSQKHGSLRMVPIIDMINHDASAGGFVELTGKERFDNGNFVDATEEDSGSFVIRSLRHGRRKALRKGQELLANYNVPHYSPLDWFVALGFVPPERWNKWQKIDAALPRIRRDGPFAEDVVSSSQIWQGFATEL